MSDRPLVMLDLYSGLHGASQAMSEHGWTVISVDNIERLRPTIVASVTDLPLAWFHVDLLWASPPCVEYSKRFQFHGFYPDAPEPSTTLWNATLRAIDFFRPTWWCIENVRGAEKVHGPCTYKFQGRCLWTNLPFMGQPTELNKKALMKMIPGESRYQSRSKIEYQVSDAVAMVVELLETKHPVIVPVDTPAL